MKITDNQKKILFIVISNALLQLVTAVCGFILPPLIVQTYGSSINGMVASINQFIVYLNLVEAGVGSASIVALYKPLALNDTMECSGVLSATKKLFHDRDK